MIVIEIPGLKPARKHPYVVEQFGKLATGESILLKTDHDPLPLYHLMLGLLGEVFDWKYLKRGTEWQVLVRKLDETELPLPEKNDPDRNCMPLNELCDLIEKKHYSYVRKTIPSLELLLVKVIELYGKQHPYLVRVLMSFRSIADELSMHMTKEGMVLFPYIRKLEESRRNGTPPPQANFPSVRIPIEMMEAEHRSVEKAVADIRRYTSDFHLPERVGETFAQAYRQLGEFERDLHRHLHLENDVLFPRAIELEAELNDNN